MAIDDDWYKPYLGDDRFARFLSAARYDRTKAIALVNWDREMRAELQKALGEWEIALRNAYDKVMSAWWSGQSHWLLDPMSPVRRPVMHGAEDINKRSRQAILRAIDRTKPSDPIGKVIANLTLDFWRYLSVRAREKSLWVPVLHRAFPKESTRPAVDHQIDLLYRLRNRVAHHEPIFHKPVPQLAVQLFSSCEQLRPELADEIVRRGTITKLWHERPVELS